MSSPPACLSAGTVSPQFFSDPPTPATEFDDSLEPLENDRDEHAHRNNHEYVLVTGGLGFIGSHTALELLKAGYNVIIVDNLSNSFRDVFDRIVMVAKLECERLGRACPKAELCCADYRDMEAMKLLLEAHSLPKQLVVGGEEEGEEEEEEEGEGEKRSAIIGVIHFAAFKEVAESIQHPLKYYQNNVKGLIDLVGLLADHHIKSFIFSSSASVYGTLSENTPRLREEACVHEREAYASEDGAQHHSEPGCTGITNPYGRSKFFGEAILADVCKADPSWTVLALRYFNPIGCDASGLLGEDPRERASNLFPAAVKVLTGQHPELCIFGTDWDTPDGSAVRDFIHVTDLARGHVAAMNAATTSTSATSAHGGRIRGTFRSFNLGTGSGHSVIEVVQTLEAVSQRSIPVRTVGRRAGDVGSCVAVPDRAGQELGWRTERSLRDACEDLWNYLQIDKI